MTVLRELKTEDSHATCVPGCVTQVEESRTSSNNKLPILKAGPEHESFQKRQEALVLSGILTYFPDVHPQQNERDFESGIQPYLHNNIDLPRADEKDD